MWDEYDNLTDVGYIISTLIAILLPCIIIYILVYIANRDTAQIEANQMKRYVAKCEFKGGKVENDTVGRLYCVRDPKKERRDILE